MQECNTYRR